MRTKLAQVLLIALLAPAAARAQSPSPAPDPLRSLDFLVGEWRGTGWVEMRPGLRHEMRVTETVRHGAGGAVLVIDGLGVDAEGQPRHQAFAVVSWDAQGGRPRLRTWRAGGGEVEDPAPTVGENTLVWGFQVPGGPRIRFTIHGGDSWHEIGEWSMDGGATWTRFLEMTLQRTP